MSTTVYEELSREIRMFVKEYDLKVVFDPIDKDDLDTWGFTLYNQSRSWGYRRLFSAFELEMLNMDKRRVAELVIEDIRKRLKEKGAI